MNCLYTKQNSESTSKSESTGHNMAPNGEFLNCYFLWKFHRSNQKP